MEKSSKGFAAICLCDEVNGARSMSRSVEGLKSTDVSYGIAYHTSGAGRA